MQLSDPNQYGENHPLDGARYKRQTAMPPVSQPPALAFCKEAPLVEISYLLERAKLGDERAGEELVIALHEELHDIARRHMLDQPANHTLQTTALLNEAWIRLAPKPEPKSRTGEPNGPSTQHWNNKRHFLAVASKAMRCVLVDHARRRGAIKRKAPGEQVALDRILMAYEESVPDLEGLDRALNQLAEVDPQLAEIVELRFFGGREMSEIAKLVDLPMRTLERRWQTARSWLKAEIL
jgi:RNA polymerase sigma-70 factor (ECF subfamily)